MSETILNNEKADRLLTVFKKLKSEDDYRRLLLDLCTPAELDAMVDRLEAARMIEEGYSYREIAEELGASSATITRVGRCLKYGAKGYEKALSVLKKGKK